MFFQSLKSVLFAECYMEAATLIDPLWVTSYALNIWYAYHFFFHHEAFILDRQSFNHPMIYQICDDTTSISKWDRVCFWIYL